MRQIFSGVPPHVAGTLRAIVLERTNVTAEWLSVRHAAATGNWGTSPQRQQTISGSSKLSARLKAAAQAAGGGGGGGGAPGPGAGRRLEKRGGGGKRGGGRGAPGRGSGRAAAGGRGAKGSGVSPGRMSFEEFEADHRKWFAQVATMHPKVRLLPP